MQGEGRLAELIYFDTTAGNAANFDVGDDSRLGGLGF